MGVPAGRQGMYDLAKARETGFKGTLEEFRAMGGLAGWEKVLQQNEYVAANPTTPSEPAPPGVGAGGVGAGGVGSVGDTGEGAPTGGGMPGEGATIEDWLAALTAPGNPLGEGARDLLGNLGLNPDAIIAEIAGGGNMSQVLAGIQSGKYASGSVTDSDIDTTKDVWQETDISKNTKGEFGTGEDTFNEFGAGEDTFNEFSTVEDTFNEFSNDRNLSGTQETDIFGTRGVDDTLGLGGLITGNLDDIGAGAGDRINFLRDVVTNGDPNFQNNVTNAINTSLSGPGMAGAGQAAQGRAAGMAAQGAAQADIGNRLSAAGQLGQGTGLEGLISAGQGLLGENFTQSGNVLTNEAEGSGGFATGAKSTGGFNAGTKNTGGWQAGTKNTGGWQDTVEDTSNTTIGGEVSNVVGKESNLTGGTATGSNLGLGFGETPMQDLGGGGFSYYFCRYYTALQQFSPELFACDIEYGNSLPDEINRNYRRWVHKFVGLLKKSRLLSALYFYSVRGWIYYAASQVRPKQYGHYATRSRRFAHDNALRLARRAERKQWSANRCLVTFLGYGFVSSVFERILGGK
jgi:hypothetical protein